MSDADVEAQIAGFIGKYSPAIQSRLRAARKTLRSFFPRGFELVFDNYNALVFGIGPTDRTSDAFVSIAGYPKWITLFFLHGKDLEDPEQLLVGDGKQVRSVRLGGDGDLDKPAVRALIEAATAAHAASFATAPPLRTIVRTVVAKQRPRRPASKA